MNFTKEQLENFTDNQLIALLILSNITKKELEEFENSLYIYRNFKRNFDWSQIADMFFEIEDECEKRGLIGKKNL